MKQIKVVRHVYDNSMNPSLGYVYVNCYKQYKKYKIAITESIDYRCKYYTLTDIETGMKAGKSFNKLKDAKSFMENTEEANFINWYNAVEHARNTKTYKDMKKVNTL